MLFFSFITCLTKKNKYRIYIENIKNIQNIGYFWYFWYFRKYHDIFQPWGAAVRKSRVPNDKLHRVTDNRFSEADVLTTRCQKVLSIKAEEHNGLRSLNWCPRVTEESASLIIMWQSISTIMSKICWILRAA